MRCIIAAVSVFLCCIHLTAQEQKTDQDLLTAIQKLDVRVFKPDSTDAKLRSEVLKQLREKVNKEDVAAWRSLKTVADWEKFRDVRLEALRKSLGRFPDAPKSVKVVTTKIIAGEGFTIENILYESRPGLYVTANLYVPEKPAKPMPGFIIIHSHHNPKTQGELQDMGMIWARQGCLVLVPDMLGHGERRQHGFTSSSVKEFPELAKNLGRQDYWFRYNNALQLHLVGESLIGWMVWDLMRGVDVLYQRPNLDKSKVMVFGSVAGGGDPCAVFAALDKRIAAAAPFNFGGPQPETKFPLPEDAELAFNYMGGGSWESTRNLRLSARDGFLPWVIVGSIAPRGLIYSHEFAWDDQRDPVWARFQKLWGMYDARDKLASAKGRGSVKGKAPESTHCNNIGSEHRKPIYPTLNKWFGLPIEEKEYRNRIESANLQCWTEEARKNLNPKLVHQLIKEQFSKTDAKLAPSWLEALGISDPRELAGKVETLPDSPRADVKVQILRHDKAPVIALPFVTILPPAAKGNVPVVIGLAQDGKAGFVKHRAETIAKLLKNGIAVCLPDLRGTGETRADGRGRSSGSTSVSATEYMHGRTVPGTQLQELVMLMRELQRQGFGNIALWGDSFVEANDPTVNFAVPYDAGKMPRQSEPMGGLLALLGGAYGGDNVKAIYVRGGLVSFRSMLDSPFCYFPHDAVIPGILRSGDMDTLAAANSKRHLRMESLVDGLNRRVDRKTMLAAYRDAAFSRPAHKLMTLSEQPASPAELAAWLSKHVR